MHLGAEPRCFLPWEMGRLTREQAFEIYLAPAKSDSEELTDPGLSHRELSFTSLRAAGMTWLQAERAYEAWQQQQLRAR